LNLIFLVLKELGLAAWNAFLDFQKERYVFLSAAVSFYTLLAVVPLLIVVASAASLIPMESINWNRIFQAIFPHFFFNNHQILVFLTHQAGAYGITGFIAAYVASQGLFRALDQALCTVFEKPVRRFRDYIRLQFMIYPFFILALITVYIVATSLSELVAKLLTYPIFREGVGYYIGSIFHKVTGLFGMMAIFLLLFMLYHFLAPRVIPRMRNSLMATTVMALLFLMVRKGFGYYFTYISNTQSIYGAFSGVFGVLLWVFVAYNLLIYGARFLFRLEGTLTP
jgi:membrane protein